jgi:hypothetical protein
MKEEEETEAAVKARDLISLKGSQPEGSWAHDYKSLGPDGNGCWRSAVDKTGREGAREGDLMAQRGEEVS